MNLLFIILLNGVMLRLILSNACLPTWSVIRGVDWSNGELVHSVTQLQYCMAACERKDSCLAIDFDSLTPSCWLYSSAHYMLNEQLQNETEYPYKTHYRIHRNRNCSELMEEDSFVEWERRSNTRSTNGEQVGYWTEYDCFTFCRNRNDCIAVDFDEISDPPCWMHTDPSNTSTVDVSGLENVVQYRFNKTNKNPEIIQIGRCIGQWFPNTTWCQPEAFILIESALFKVHPLCSMRNSDDAHPPDAPWLPNVFVQYLDPIYYSEFLACNGSFQCYLRSKCPLSSTYDEECGNYGIKSNFISVTYTCVNIDCSIAMSGRTVPFTCVTQAHITTSFPSLDSVPYENNSLIIKVVVGVVVPFILSAAAVIVFVVIKKRRRHNETTVANNKRTAVYCNYEQRTVKYDSRTVQRGSSTDNEVNEISMNVDTF